MNTFKKQELLPIFLPCVVALSQFGCAASATTSTATMSPRIAVPGVTNAITLMVTALDQFASSVGILTAGDYNSAGVAAVTSLQYYITRIQFCESLTMGAGTGYSGQSGCIDVFGTSSADNAYTTYKVADADADTTSTNWVDLMSATSLAAFAANSKAVAVGTYNYVLVESRKPVKLNAAFTVGGAALRTCTDGTVSSTGTGESLYEIRTVADMTACTRATTTIGSNGGGNYFKLATPVTIAAGKTYVLDLGFDADLAVWGGSHIGIGTITYKDTANSKGIFFPPLSVAPVLRESTQKLVREQYDIAVTTGAPGTLRVNLYYAGLKGAVGTGSIQGVETRFLQTADTASISYVDKATSITDTSGTVTLKNYLGTSIISSLVRSTTETAGGTSTVTLNNAAVTVGNAYITGTQTATVTFKGVTEL